MSPVHLDRLREAMAPDPGEWRFTGRVNDTGVVGGSRCSCGRDIRYEFIIARNGDGAELIIGSHCIETSVPYLIKAGAGVLAGELQHAYLEHRRALDREASRRESAARAHFSENGPQRAAAVLEGRAASLRGRGESAGP